MTLIKPGCNLTAGSDPARYGVRIPHTAIDKWESEFGWQDQHHIRSIGLGTIQDKRGLGLLINLARRIVDGGGYIQLLILGTPESMASIPTDQVDWRGNPVYPHYPPRDYKTWAALYVKVVNDFLQHIPADRVLFNIWHEPNGWWWRGSDKAFYQLYGVVQDAIKAYQAEFNVQLRVGGYQHCDLADVQYGPDYPPYLQTRSRVFAERFFRLAREHAWQVDFFDMFAYDWQAERVVREIRDMEGLMLDYGIDAEPIFNCLSHAGRFGDHRPYIDPWSEESARYTLTLAKLLYQQTGVRRAGFDFLEDSAQVNWPNYFENGLLESETLKERPRWGVVRKIQGWRG